MVDISEFLKSERAAYERDPEKYKKERAEDARLLHKRERFFDPDLMERYERMQKHKESKGGARSGGGGGGGMNPADIEKVPGKRPLKMKKGGSVSSASKRADGCAIRGKTRA